MRRAGVPVSGRGGGATGPSIIAKLPSMPGGFKDFGIYRVTTALALRPWCDCDVVLEPGQLVQVTRDWEDLAARRYVFVGPALGLSPEEYQRRIARGESVLTSHAVLATALRGHVEDVKNQDAVRRKAFP